MYLVFGVGPVLSYQEFLNKYVYSASFICPRCVVENIVRNKKEQWNDVTDYIFMAGNRKSFLQGETKIVLITFV